MYCAVKTRTTRILLAALILAVCTAGCGDKSESTRDSAQNATTRKSLPWLSTKVGRYPLETSMAAEIFDAQAGRKAREIEWLALKQEKSLRDPSLLDGLQKIVEQESLRLIDHDAAVLEKYVRVERLQGGDVPGISVLLKGSDSNRRLVLASGVMPRRVAAGHGANAMELAAALEVMRVCISRRAIGNDPPLPFDLELVYLAGADPGMTWLGKTAETGVELLGVVCLEEMTPARPGASNLVLHVEPSKASTLVHALSGTLQQYCGKSMAWDTASVTADLKGVPEKVGNRFSQDWIPVCVIRASNSASDRSLRGPAGGRKWLSQQASADPAHKEVGGPNDRLKKVCDEKFRTVVSVARVIAIAVTRVPFSVLTPLGCLPCPAAPMSLFFAMTDQIPDSKMLCYCRNVDYGAVRAAIRDGDMKRVEQVMNATTAGTGCRSCVPEIEQLLDEHRRMRGGFLARLMRKFTSRS